MKQTLIHGGRCFMALMYEICKNTHFFTLHFAVTKKTVGDGEKLLTYLNSVWKALLGFDIFPRVPKKKSEILLPSVICISEVWYSSDCCMNLLPLWGSVIWWVINEKITVINLCLKECSERTKLIYEMNCV